MPEIWDDSPFLTTVDELLGALAEWAVKQSPYLCPDNLQQALEEFTLAIPYDRDVFADSIFETSCEWLIPFVRGLFEACPSILAWNEPKFGKHRVAFSSRYDSPKPDYDFIDLDALARNIAHSITVTNKVSIAQDQMNDPLNADETVCGEEDALCSEETVCVDMDAADAVGSFGEGANALIREGDNYLNAVEAKGVDQFADPATRWENGEV